MSGIRLVLGLARVGPGHRLAVVVAPVVERGVVGGKVEGGGWVVGGKVGGGGWVGLSGANWAGNWVWMVGMLLGIL